MSYSTARYVLWEPAVGDCRWRPGAGRKGRKDLARSLPYRTPSDLAEAEQALERFADRWDTQYPAISPSWLADWDRLTVFFDYPPAIRRAISTTNAIESLNYSLRKVLKGRRAFPNDEAILKVLVHGAAAYRQKVDPTDSGVESGAESVRDFVWRAGEGVNKVTQIT